MENIETYKINDSDFIIYKRDGSIKSGGFSLSSVFKTQKGGKENPHDEKESISKDVVVPSGLFYSEKKQHTKTQNYNEEQSNKEIPDELYDNLLKMASKEYAVDNNKHKRKTRKSKQIKYNKKTLKNTSV